jgi:putative endonuclease
MREYYVYILTNWTRSTLYTGVTRDLERRLVQHKNKTFSGFTARYNVNLLIYFESFHDVRDAIAREKEIKGWVRAKKNALISEHNPSWEDLSGLVLPDDQR